MNPGKLRLLVLLALVAATAACGVFRKARTPMPQVAHQVAPEVVEEPGLLVLFPGFGDRAETFEEEGFVEIAEASGVPYDVAALDAHFGYYRTWTVLDRAGEDIIEPAASDGIERMWVVGISMGGTGAIGTAREHADVVDGVILLAPYLGPGSLIREIHEAGGLASWDAGNIEEVRGKRERYFRRLWTWLQGYATGEPRPALRFGTGADDNATEALALLEPYLPDDATQVIPGGHDWTVWRPLFETFLAQGLPAE